MSKLPPISPDPNFDRDVMLRAWLGSMDQTVVPDGFDTSVLRSAKRTRLWQGIASLLVLTMASVSVWMYVDKQPDPVRVSYVPQSPLPLVNLYELPPLEVKEDLRFIDTVKPVRPEPFGVAGY